MDLARPRISRRRVRLVFLLVLFLSIATLAHGAATGLSTATAEDVPRAEPRDGITVATESAKYGTINAWAPNGSLLYYNNSHTKYFDVDPVANESRTVEYVATDTIHTSGPNCADPPCARNTVERLNLSTGQTTLIYERYVRRETAGEWHDHVRIDDQRLLIADILNNRVYIVNTTTELVEWSWDARSEFPVSGGGPYPGDWAHINDVSLLDDGRVMVSLRNQDQVVFVDPETGMDHNWTLGADDDHETLYEQHNPDYIPAERGGPAVLVADSENARIVEYQRTDGDWNRTWTWEDDQMQWPRDADRLPNGHTLIADTNGKRILELDRDGTIVWSIPLSHPYDVERLGTGDESSGGESASRLGLESRTSAAGENSDEPSALSILAILSGVVHALLPPRVVNAAIYVGPTWMTRVHFAAATVAVGSLLLWTAVELRWRAPSLGLRWPVYRNDGEK